MRANWPANPNSFVLLQLGAQRFAMRSDRVAELAPPVQLHWFPHTTPLIEGVVVRRGRIVPVYDLATPLTGVPPPLHRFYLIARCRFGSVEQNCGLLVHGDCELVTAEIQAPAEGRPALVVGQIQVENEYIEVLDLEELPGISDAASEQDSAGEAEP